MVVQVRVPNWALQPAVSASTSVERRVFVKLLPVWHALNIGTLRSPSCLSFLPVQFTSKSVVLGAPVCVLAARDLIHFRGKSGVSYQRSFACVFSFQTATSGAFREAWRSAFVYLSQASASAVCLGGFREHQRALCRATCMPIR